jgi:hypothetical protein
MMTEEGIGKKTKDTLFVGFEVGTGKEVYIPIFHMLVAGQTQLSGKTTLLKTLANQAVEQGYKVLCFDSKSNFADYDTFGKEIPICFRETTDSLTILGLLESIMERKLTQQFATLIRATEGAHSFVEVLENAEEVKEKTRSGFVHDAATTLVDLMGRLIEQTRDRKTSSKLELPHTINRMTINKFALEAQQMVIKTAIEDALVNPKLIVIIDEMSKFLPQQYRSACKPAIERYVTQGAITKTFLWGGSQFLATTAKSVMKAMDVKILGRQSHDTECEHTLDLIPKLGNIKWTESHIMQLELGHFVVAAENWVKIVYTVPEYADRHECHQVAMGKRKPKEIHYRYEKLLSSEEIQKLQKALAGTEVIKIEAPEKVEPKPEKKKEPEKTKIELGDAEDKIEIKEPITELNDYVLEKANKKPTKELHTDRKYKPVKPQYSGRPPQFQPWNERFERVENRVDALYIKVDKLSREQNLAVAQVVDDITLQENKTKIHIGKVIKQVKVSDETYRGKVLTIAKEGFFNSWHGLRDIVEALEKHGWTANKNTVKLELYAMAKEQLLGSKKGSSREFLYIISPNIQFVDDEE